MFNPDGEWDGPARPLSPVDAPSHAPSPAPAPEAAAPSTPAPPPAEPPAPLPAPNAAARRDGDDIRQAKVRRRRRRAAMESTQAKEHDASIDSCDSRREEAEEAKGKDAHRTAIPSPVGQGAPQAASPPGDASDGRRTEVAAPNRGMHPTPGASSPSRKHNLPLSARRGAAAKLSPKRNGRGRGHEIDDEALNFFRSVVAQRSTDRRWAASAKTDPPAEDRRSGVGKTNSPPDKDAISSSSKRDEVASGAPRGSLSRDVQRVNRFHDVLFNPKPKPATAKTASPGEAKGKNVAAKRSSAAGENAQKTTKEEATATIVVATNAELGEIQNDELSPKREEADKADDSARGGAMNEPSVESAGVANSNSSTQKGLLGKVTGPKQEKERGDVEEFSPDDAIFEQLVESEVASPSKSAANQEGIPDNLVSPPKRVEMSKSDEDSTSNDATREPSKPGKLVIPNIWSANQHALPTLDETQETEGSVITGISISNNYALAMIRENKERIRRFEEAYNAIIEATDAHQRPANDAEIMARWLEGGGKRWARDPSMAAAVSIDGRVYDDYQRTPTIPVKQQIEAALRGDSYDNRLHDQAAYEHWLAYDRRIGQPEGGGQTRAMPNPSPQKGCPLKGVNVGQQTTPIDGQGSRKDNEPGQTPSMPAKRQMDSIRPEEGDETGLHGKAVHEFWQQRSQPNTEGNAQTTLTSKPNPLLSADMATSEEDIPLSKKKLSDAESTGDTTKTTELVSEHDESNLDLLDNLHIAQSDPASLKYELMQWKNKFRGANSPLKAETNGEEKRGAQEPAGDESIEMERTRIPQDPSGNQLQDDDQQPNESSYTATDTRQLAAAALVKESLFAHMFEGSIIDTDGTEVSFNEEEYALKMQSLLLSPSIITKRYQQALTVIEGRSWNQLSYLLSANPWLMEMKDVRNDQTLVHALSLFGGGPSDVDPLPMQLAKIILDYDSNVAHKLDVEGNLPLHFAAAAGNVTMIRELGHLFPSAASVQNHNDLLPLHLAIMACDLFSSGVQAAEQILALFPGATRVRDNDGNTPLHLAASLRGTVGAHVVNLLVEHCGGDAYTEKNNLDDSPLATAIKSMAGSQVVDALLTTSAGKSAVLETNSASQNALHLVLGSECDVGVVFSLLKAAPSTATIRDGRGLLPIEIAYSNSLQNEVLFAIAIIDLPIDLGAKDGAIVRRGFGTSWLYLLSETNDACVGVVNSILDICSLPQRIALCFATTGDKRDRRIAISRATPFSKLALRRSVGSIERFELVGDEKKSRAFLQQLQEFQDALSHVDDRDVLDHAGKKATVVCYTNAYEYSVNAKHLRPNILDARLVEELSHFTLNGIDAQRPSGVLNCVAVEKPTLSLASVVSGMKRQHRSDLTILGRYFSKCRSILRQTAKALRHLHSNNIVHGHLDSSQIGKFEDRWKVTGLIGSAVRGEEFRSSRLGKHSPPEAFVLVRHKHSRESNVSLDSSLEAEPAVDVWAFGKLMYEVLVGEPLFTAFSEKEQSDLPRYIFAWDDSSIRRASKMLLGCRVGEAGVHLISRCLQQNSSARISTADILQHPFWKDGDAFDLS